MTFGPRFHVAKPINGRIVLTEDYASSGEQRLASAAHHTAFGRLSRTAIIVICLLNQSLLGRLRGVACTPRFRTVIGMVWSDLVLVWSRPPRLGLVWGFFKTVVGPVLMV